MTSAIGFVLLLCGIGTQVYLMIVSIRERRLNSDITGDPWNGRTLEWSTSSPPPFYNFAVIPEVTDQEEFWLMKQAGNPPQQHYEDILLPENTGMGIYISIFAFLMAFGLIWQIVWLVILGAIGAIACVIRISFDEHREYVLTANEIAHIEATRREG
jgi:cytochrome o ubiquinol oxidase subunit I